MLAFAAMDTSVNSLSRIIHLLVQHPDMQEKVRKEIMAASAGHDIPFDELMALPYLDTVVRETMRV